jgi:hypothetical protein
LQKYVINPSWLKQSVYRITRESESRQWISREEIEREVRSADAALTSMDEKFAAHADGTAVAEAFLRLVDLSFFDSASAFEVTKIAAYQCASDPKNPLKSLSPADQDEVLVEICKKIEAAYTGSS